MQEHYYSENPTSFIKEKNFTQKINNITLTFLTVSGVFSFENKIDKASEMLIKNFTPSGKSILDLGCGYGAIGLFLKAIHSEQTVFLSDINSRAVKYSETNAGKNFLNVTVIKSNLYSNISNKLFDDIVTNPPIAAGKKVNRELINEAWGHLNIGGSLWLVAFHNKGGSTLNQIMKERFGNSVDIEKSGGIRLYKSIKLV